MNNDGSVDAYDIDGFAAAVSSCSGYGSAYPGQGGSCVYHGDFTCDGNVNSYDTDGFIDRLSDPDTCVTCEEGDCDNCAQDGGGGGSSLTPSELAALIENYVAPARLSVMIEIVADLVEYHGDSPRGEFWAAVLAELA